MGPACNGPLVRLVLDLQWTQADLDVTDIAKEQQTEGETRTSLILLGVQS